MISVAGRWALPGRHLSLLVLALFVSAAYLYAFPQANLIYPLVVLLHAFGGVAALLFLVPWLLRNFRQQEWSARLAWVAFLVGSVPGLVLLKIGTRHSHYRWLNWHMGLSVLAGALLLSIWASRRGWFATGILLRVARVGACLVLLAGLSALANYCRHAQWSNRSRIENPHMPTATMDEEGDGASGPFFPSSAQVAGGGKIPSKYFMESEVCARCHKDIYEQWKGSAHHFSSFNNQWYRKSIEYMQDVAGTKPSKWCGGCHDPAVLYSGLMDTPIKQIVHRPEAQAGLGCMMCHSIVQVKSTMGQADFLLEYPKLHELASSPNPAMRWLHDFLVDLNPEPHRRIFLKPFMRNQTAEFCSACHKVHLDKPVNHYRWIRGFNEYDNWQASGVSGQGARSFYYPAKAQGCADCHMPLESSEERGNVNGYVHSHRFPAANTAVPTANDDPEQLQATEEFLKNKNLTVDIFALSPARATDQRVSAQADLNTTFAVGEEAEVKTTANAEGEAAPVTAPLNRVQPSLRRGDDVRVDVVVRTKKVGHFFPGGTVDAYDTWLELKGTDDKGQTVFWSGMVEDNGKGPVEKGAHFYRSLQIDGHGNHINKRNAWATRSVVYVRLIPPGAADTVHYRMHVPENAGSKITLHARLLYRKFAWWNTQFSFAGEADPGQPAPSVDGDDRTFNFHASLKGVSAKREEIVDVPIETVAEIEVTLPVSARGSAAAQPKTELHKEDWQRWNDYGIGLFLQGDLKAAQAAFQKVTEIDATNPDGWVNLGRVAVQEGDMERARGVLQKALALKPDLARANFFYAKVLRNDGNYDDAANRLRSVVAQYPRDRVAQNDLGRILFLQRKYQEAVQQLQLVLAIDPEDLQAHYNLMLCYNGLGDTKQAHEHEVRYLRFKADESAQAITGNYRLLHPEDNNERQAIHEHVSVKLPLQASAKATQKYALKKNPAPKSIKPKYTKIPFAKPGVGN
jgi:tetratricopeptide (TPR) repeat protein